MGEVVIMPEIQDKQPATSSAPQESREVSEERLLTNLAAQFASNPAMQTEVLGHARDAIGELRGAGKDFSYLFVAYQAKARTKIYQQMLTDLDAMNTQPFDSDRDLG